MFLTTKNYSISTLQRKKIQKKLLCATSPQNKPRRTARLKLKTTQKPASKIKFSNRFELKGADWQKNKLNKSIEITLKAVKNKMKTSNTIFNIPSAKLSESEKSFLNKELNLRTKEHNKEQLLICFDLF